MPNLILIPTQIERGRLLAKLTTAALDPEQWRCELCGFGLVAAAARASQLIAKHRPQRVLLCGIAGTYDASKLRIGEATVFTTVICHGIGIGDESEFTSASDLGWSQFSESGLDVHDTLALATGQGDASTNSALLSCCAASSNPSQAEHRLRRHPDVIAEDMEGFGVAFSCALAGLNCQIIRGISNVAGNRDHADWQIDRALESVANLLPSAIA